MIFISHILFLEILKQKLCLNNQNCKCKYFTNVLGLSINYFFYVPIISKKISTFFFKVGAILLNHTIWLNKRTELVYLKLALNWQLNQQPKETELISHFYFCFKQKNNKTENCVKFRKNCVSSVCFLYRTKID